MTRIYKPCFSFFLLHGTAHNFIFRQNITTYFGAKTVSDILHSYFISLIKSFL